MSKFNSKVSPAKADSVNMAGGKAYSRDSIKEEIATVVLNTMLNGNMYYETETDRLARIESLISQPEVAEFVAKTMVYTRTIGNLRSISHFLAGILSENVKGSDFLRSALNKSFVRPDDLTETLSLWNARNKGKMVPNALRRAMKDSLEGFDNYQLKKYEGSRNAVKLRDVVKLAHPKGDYKALIEGRMDNIQTAQTVNAAGTEDRASNYKEMLSNRKLGYMGALKNIKNILEAGADAETIDMLCTLLRNERACLNSRVLPFRFIQAYEIVKGMNIDRILAKKLIKAIEDGFIISGRNVPIVDEGEKVAILLDESGSMGPSYSRTETDSTCPFGHGKALMASMLTGLDQENTVGYLWADNAREVSIDGSPFDFIARTRRKGAGTNVHAALEGLIKTKTNVDKIVILTDMQMYDVDRWSKGTSQFKDIVTKYRKINPNIKILFWNLRGYVGGTPIKLSHDILEVSGFSDKIMSVIPKMWKDKGALIKEIETIDLAS